MKSFLTTGGSSMNQDKILILFEQIGLEEQEKEELKDLSLAKFMFFH